MPTRRSYKGNAAQTSLSGGVSSSVTAIPVVDGSTFPDGSAGPFFVVLDKGQVGEEKILVATRVGNSFTVVTRGADDSAAAAHLSGASVNHCISKTDVDEANAHTTATSGVHGVTGAVVGTTDTQTLSGKTLTTPTIADHTNAQHTHTSAAQGGSVVGGHGVRCYSTVDQSVSGALTLLFNTEAYDADGYHSTSSNTSRLTVPAGLGGYYTIFGFCILSGLPTTDNLLIRVLLNGGTSTLGTKSLQHSSSAVVSYEYLDISLGYRLSAGDYVELNVARTGAGTATASASSTENVVFGMTYNGA